MAGGVPLLRFENVSFKYDEDEDKIIENLSFNVNKGQFVSIIGASGCGKSTIFRLVTKLLKADEGEIFVDGKNIKDGNIGTGYMPQKDLLFPWRTIKKNILLPMEIHKKDKKEMSKKADDILKQVGLYEYKDKYPKDLSGGMRQRISFARTLLTESDLLLLDEPFSALDSLTRLSMQEWLIDQWQHMNKTVVFITHDVEEAIFLSSHIYVVTDDPIKELKEIEVPLSYPRTRDQLKRDDMIELKEDLINQLRRQVVRS